MWPSAHHDSVTLATSPTRAGLILAIVVASVRLKPAIRGARSRQARLAAQERCPSRHDLYTREDKPA
jgi:hypothetical protein